MLFPAAVKRVPVVKGLMACRAHLSLHQGWDPITKTAGLSGPAARQATLLPFGQHSG